VARCLTGDETATRGVQRHGYRHPAHRRRGMRPSRPPLGREIA